uniref:Zinc finger protein 365 n=1 Tax=Astyanax mexicanus TaxID=7994 RepID=A0A3B1JVW5_ASTMX
MQQKVCTRNTTLFVENGLACGAGAPSQLPFRCPRCGEHERFHSLAALRAHLEYSHTYHTHPRHDFSLPNSRGHSFHDFTDDCKRANAKTQTTKDAGTDTHSLGRGEHKLPLISDPPPPEQCPQGPPSPEKSIAGGETPVGTELLSVPVASVGQRLEGMMRNANSSMERRLLRLSSELAQTDTALICERAHSHHLAQERQEVLERERALSRQVDAAVMVIATLRQQLSMSEHELERRKEVITIQKFLEAAAQHEMCGKVRLRRFIENLLRRIALAERLLEYYQSAPHEHYCTAHPGAASADIGPQRITKSRSTGEQLVHEEEQAHGLQAGWGASRVSGERLGHQGCWLQRSRSDGYEV